MRIAGHPPGLVSRRAFRPYSGKVVVREEWNIDVPGCPMIRNPWMPRLGNDGPIFIRQVEMTEEEYQNAQVCLTSDA